MAPRRKSQQDRKKNKLTQAVADNFAPGADDLPLTADADEHQSGAAGTSEGSRKTSKAKAAAPKKNARGKKGQKKVSQLQIIPYQLYVYIYFQIGQLMAEHEDLEGQADPPEIVALRSDQGRLDQPLAAEIETVREQRLAEAELVKKSDPDGNENYDEADNSSSMKQRINTRVQKPRHAGDISSSSSSNKPSKPKHRNKNLSASRVPPEPTMKTRSRAAKRSSPIEDIPVPAKRAVRGKSKTQQKYHC